MAISQVSKGVYVITPEKVDTQGGKYVGIFTKAREEQWQLAQKQAALEADIATKSYAEQLKIYRDKIDAMNAQVRDLAKMKERALAGELTAKDRAELESWRLQARRDEKLAQRTPVSQGSTTVTEKTGGGAGGRGGKGPQLGSVTAAEQAEIDAALATAQDDPATAAAAIAAARQAKSLSARTAEDTDAQNVSIINSLATARATATGEDIDTATDNVLQDLNTVDGQYASSFQRVQDKKTEIETGTGGGTTRTTTTRPGAKMEPTYEGLATRPGAGPDIFVEPRAGLIDKIDEQRDALQKKISEERAPQFEGFDYITRARQIAAGRFGPTSPSPAYGQRNALQALFQADPAMQQAILDTYRASLPPPAAVPPSTAPITAPGTPAPATPKGWESVGIVRPAEDDPEIVARAKASGKSAKEEAEAAYTAAKEAWTAAQGGKTPPITAPAEEFPMAPGLGVAGLTSEAVEAGAAALTPGLDPGAKSALQQLADKKFAAAERLAGQEARIATEEEAADRPFQMPFEERGGETVPFYRKPGGRADVRSMLEYLAGRDNAEASGTLPAGAPIAPPTDARSGTEAGAVAPADIRPEAAALMTPAEREAFRAELAARSQKSPLQVARETRFMPPASLPAPERPQMAPTASVAETFAYTPRLSGAVAPPPPSIGTYTPGPGPTPVPPSGPSTADVAPRTAAAAPPGYLERPSRPLAANAGAQMAIREGAEAAEASAAAKKQMADIKAAGAEDVFRGPKPSKVETKEAYLLSRLEAAYPLAKKTDKLERVIASGPGKVAYDLYVANKAKGIPFSKTYEEITMTFAGDRKAMEQGHNVALALDIKDGNTAPGGK